MPNLAGFQDRLIKFKGTSFEFFSTLKSPGEFRSGVRRWFALC